MESKLKDFGDEGDKYKQRVYDMKRVTEIEKKTNQGIDLTKDELEFIYEVDRDIEGFRYGRDPRIKEILSTRDIKKDFACLVDMSGSDYSSSLLVNTLLDNDYDGLVAKYLGDFSDLDSSVAIKLINKGQDWSVVEHLHKFPGLDRNDIANRILKSGRGWSVAEHLPKFPGLDHNDTAHKLVGNGKIKALARNLPNFSGLDSSVANILIGKGYRERVAKNLSSFTNLDSSVLEKLK